MFSFWLLGDALYALGFMLATLVAFAVLTGVALLFIKGIKTYFPKRWGFAARQSLLNLFRPNNQTVVLVVAIGLGTCLISTLYFTKDILLAKTEVGQSSSNANIIILDVQSDQQETVEARIKAKGLPVVNSIPIVTMRIHKIKGRLANDLRQDSTKQMRNWILNHEFRSTYRDAMIDSEELLEGEWTSHTTPNAPILVSIADNLVEDGIDIGDNITFNVQGVLMETTVGSIRKVDWRQLQPNFNLFFLLAHLSKHHNLVSSLQMQQMKLVLQHYSAI
ncbi:putative ABC transporter, permease protein [Winogradskyella psychrotolerans RS-3]|uniref:Putative ABC transporter, permease protein n=1 Tax=Winogradskyella psychrotolerans RS-3 TaxID=641526 RepID=S7VKA2_9FLAO|nr:putative ABC transporter, permease protein [Winogradskyella psychrotolerans RS-3]